MSHGAPKRLPGPSWEKGIVGVLGSGTETLMDTQSHRRTVSSCAQKEKLGFVVVVVDKEQRNKLLTNL